MKRLTKRQFFIAFIVANVITQFLFFIDEGYYDLRWMRLWGNWVVYVIYVAAIWGLSLLLQVAYIFMVFVIRKLFFKTR